MRTVAICSGGDWSDAKVDHVEIPDEMDLNEELEKYFTWYRDVYCKDWKPVGDIEYQTFAEWLLNNGASEADVEEFWNE